MLIACRTTPPSRGLTVTGSQYHRARRVEMHDKMHSCRRPTPPWSAITGMRWVVEAGKEVKKYSLAVIGEVSAPASRIQVNDHSHDAVVLLRANNIQNGRLVFSDIQVVPEAIVKTDQLLAFGDMAVCMSNGSKSLVGKSAQYKGSLSGDVTVGAFCSIFRPKKDADSGYIKQVFHSAIYQAHIDYSLAGSAINNLKNSDIESLELMVPPKFIQLGFK